MDYLIRFVQVHESFRKPEIEALATLNHISFEWILYDETSPFSLIHLQDDASARLLISRSILAKGIYQLGGHSNDIDSLCVDVRTRSSDIGASHAHSSFRFDFDAFQGTLAPSSRESLIRNLIQELSLTGPINLSSPDEIFRIFLFYDHDSHVVKQCFFGRFIANSSRHLLGPYSLKTRPYINTTSMDSELAFLTANLSLAGQGRVFYDPFIGTGSLPIACAHFGSPVLGSDIDGRMLRGPDKDQARSKNIATNFKHYGLQSLLLDGFISDLTHSPLRKDRWLDGIVCDPPYGIREGLKVLGSKDGKAREAVFINGEAAHLQDSYIPPKQPYSLTLMLNNILYFAATMLIDNGRVSIWMPTANDEDGEVGIPHLEAMELVSCCVQKFNKWSRRLLTYRRIPGVEVQELDEHQSTIIRGTADELNSFRKRFFEGFKT